MGSLGGNLIITGLFLQVGQVFLVGIVKEVGVRVELVHVALRWLVQIQFGSSVSDLLGSLSLKSCYTLLLFQILEFLIFSFFLGSLDLLELIEDVLVVKESVRELILEDVMGEVLAYSVFDALDLQKLVDGWSLGWVSLEHHGQQVRHLL